MCPDAGRSSHPSPAGRPRGTDMPPSPRGEDQGLQVPPGPPQDTARPGTGPTGPPHAAQDRSTPPWPPCHTLSNVAARALPPTTHAQARTTGSTACIPSQNLHPGSATGRAAGTRASSLHPPLLDTGPAEQSQSASNLHDDTPSAEGKDRETPLGCGRQRRGRRPAASTRAPRGRRAPAPAALLPTGTGPGGVPPPRLSSAQERDARGAPGRKQGNPLGTGRQETQGDWRAGTKTHARHGAHVGPGGGAAHLPDSAPAPPR